MVGKIMFEELVLPALSLKPITVVGKSWIETELTTSSIVAEKVALPELSSKHCIAFIPLGVAALPSPKILEAMFIAICLLASGLLLLNKNFMIGASRFANFALSPLLSNISKSPSQTA